MAVDNTKHYDDLIEHKITFVFHQEILDDFYSTSMSNDISIELESKDGDNSGSFDLPDRYIETIFELFCRSKLSDFTLLDWLYIKIFKLFTKNIPQSEYKVILSFPNFPRFDIIDIEYEPRLFFLEHSVRTRFIKFLGNFIFCYEEEMRRRKKNKYILLGALFLINFLYLSYIFYFPLKIYLIDLAYWAVFIFVFNKIYKFYTRY